MILVIVLACLPIASAEEAGEIEVQDDFLSICEDAGKNGCYRYNEETGTFDYIPASEYDYLPLDIDEGEYDIDSDSQDVMPMAGGTGLTLVSSPSRYETSTCLIGARFSDNYVKHGTGFLINSQYLLTAAHVVYDQFDYGYGYSSHVAVYVGASGGTFKQYRLGHVYLLGGDFVVSDDYVRDGRYDDWAIVKLDSPITVSVSYLKPRAVNSASDMTGTYTTQGYPCELNKCANKYGTNKWDNSKMYKSTGRVTRDNPRYLPVVESNISMEEGQSGSPIWINGFVEAIGVSRLAYNGKYTAYLILINNWLYNCISKNCY